MTTIALLNILPNGFKERGIYKIINVKSGAFYIGSSEDVYVRLRGHLNHFKNSRHSNKRMQRSWDKCSGEDFFAEIIEIVVDPNELLSREQFWLDCSILNPLCMNICAIAGNTKGVLASEETKAKQSAVRKGRKRSEETNLLLSSLLKGKKKPDHLVKALSDFNRGTKRSDESKRLMSLAKIGKKLNPEHTKKIADSNRGKKRDAEFCKQLSERKKLWWAEKKKGIENEKHSSLQSD